MLCLTGSLLADASTADVQILAINDFHGQLGPGKELHGRPVGSAAVLAAYLREAMASFPGDTLIVHAGDQVGASPPESGLLQDEPSIAFLDLLANRHCRRAARMDARCNVVGTLGNHEFDEGAGELLRLIHGGRHARGPFLASPYRGASFPYVSANVVDTRGRDILPRSVVKLLGGVRVGVVGAVLRDTPSMVVQSGVRDVRFLPEVEAINREVHALTRRGVKAIVVAIHQGTPQEPYDGPTRADRALPEGLMRTLITGLDDAVDVVVSGHAHAFTNALVENANGHAILVTQAFSAGTAFAQITLTLADGDVRQMSARIINTYADTGPGLSPDAEVAELVRVARAKVAPISERVVAHAREALVRAPGPAGESPLGKLIADAQRAACKADVAFMNPGGIRSDLPAGELRWGQLFAVHPFGNTLVSMTLAGAQIRAVLAHQSSAEHAPLLAVSGIRYLWDPARPPAERASRIEIARQPLRDDALYRVCVNSFLAEGGSGFTMFAAGVGREAGPTDLDALIAHAASGGGVLSAPTDARVWPREHHSE